MDLAPLAVNAGALSAPNGRDRRLTATNKKYITNRKLANLLPTKTRLLGNYIFLYILSL
jgi:hypothetical protein